MRQHLACLLLSLFLAANAHADAHCQPGQPTGMENQGGAQISAADLASCQEEANMWLLPSLQLVLEVHESDLHYLLQRDHWQQETHLRVAVDGKLDLQIDAIMDDHNSRPLISRCSGKDCLPPKSRSEQIKMLIFSTVVDLQLINEQLARLPAAGQSISARNRSWQLELSAHDKGWYHFSQQSLRDPQRRISGRFSFATPALPPDTLSLADWQCKAACRFETLQQWRASRAN